MYGKQKYDVHSSIPKDDFGQMRMIEFEPFPQFV